MKQLESFTNLYPVSKTLRFELIPQGKTLEHIQNANILKKDEALAESYQKMKKTIDEFHKDFINRSLSNVSLTRLNDFYELYTSPADLRKTDDHKSKMAAIKDALRKEIAAYFTSNASFSVLNKKELINEALEKWIDANHASLYFDPAFKEFTTYFTGYNENRMNLYSSDQKASAVSFRLIDENLPKFIDNIFTFTVVTQRLSPSDIKQLSQDLEPWLNGYELNELFTVASYNHILTQPQIDAYNTIIAGRTDGNTKIKGLNEYINLYNQTHPDKKLPLFKELYKQLLSDRISASWLPEKFDDVQALFEAVNGFCADVINEQYLSSLHDAIHSLEEATLDSVYLRSDAFASISNALFDRFDMFYIALHIDFGQSKSDDYYSIDNVQASLNQYQETLEKEDRRDADIVAYIIQRTDKAIDAVKANYQPVKDTLSVAHDGSLNQQETACLKTFLDSVLDLLHTIKPIYLPSDEPVKKDSVFYSVFSPLYEDLSKITKLYDKVRNFATKKPTDTNKIKLNFSCSTLLNGWDLNKERENLGVLFFKDGNYYLGIMDKANNKCLSDLPLATDENCYEKVVYKYLPSPHKMLPKVFFSKKWLQKCIPSDEILAIHDKKTYLTNPDDCSKLIDYYKDSIKKYPEWGAYDFRFSPTAEYNKINDFYREVTEQGYKLCFQKVDCSFIDSLVNDGKLYLFQIYSKDFSRFSKGKPNLHTLYWNALFAKENLANVVYKLNGEAEVFYRKHSIEAGDTIKHPANQPIEVKNPILKEKGKTCVFPYDLTKNYRYTVDKFQLHIPITMNYHAIGSPQINKDVCAYLRGNKDVNIIGIDRGERHLLYISMIDRNGQVVKDRNGKDIQYSLNTLSGEYKNSSGELVSFKTPYHDLLAQKELQRTNARKAWTAIEGIKDLKSGYMSQVVHHIAKLMVEYNAIIVMEDLNSGFKNSRKKIERQVYQNFEKALIEKLNYLVFKDSQDDQPASLYRALQLSNHFESFKSLTKQCGFIFYVPAWNTSKIDPVTGFVDLLKPKYQTIKEAISLFEKFDSFCYNSEKNWFEFSFDYSKFTDKAQGTKTKWTVCTVGELRYTYNRTLNGGRGGYERYNVTEKLKALFEKYKIDLCAENLIPAIASQNSSEFFKTLIKCLQVTLAMRYTSSDDEKDFILSPVADADGNFFCSEDHRDGLPQDADANGAFNIARKGLWVLEHIDSAAQYNDWTTKISNKEWLNYVQTRF